MASLMSTCLTTIPDSFKSNPRTAKKTKTVLNGWLMENFAKNMMFSESHCLEILKRKCNYFKAKKFLILCMPL